MFRVRMPELVRGLDTVTCTIENIAVHAKYMTGTMLFAHFHNPTYSTQHTFYNPQRDFALAQAQLHRYNH